MILPAPVRAALAAFGRRHGFLIRFALISLVLGLAVGLGKVTTTLYALHLGAQGWTLGAIAAAQSIGVLAMSLPLGIWVERHGPLKLFIAGSSALVGIYLLLPAWPVVGFLLAMTALTSFFMPFRFITLNTVFIAQLAEIGEARAGWFRGSHMMGMFLIGPVLAAGVVQALGHAGSYRVIAALVLLTIVMAPWVFGPQGGQAAGVDGAAPRGRVIDELRLLLRDPRARRLALAESCVQALNMYYAFYIVVIAVQQLGLAPGPAGSLVAVQGAAFVSALFLLGPMVERLGSRALGVGVGTVVTATLLLGLSPHPAGLWLGGGLLGLGLGLLQVHTLTQLARLGQRIGRGRISGLSGLAGPSGGLLGGLMGGLLGPAVGLQLLFLAFVPAFALLAWKGRVNLPAR